MRLGLRFDMRAPGVGASASELYAAAIDMAEWADELGFDTVYFAEHHGAEDGHCPAPIVQAASVAARTHRAELRISALLAALRHPIQTAEELAVLDIISAGRAAATLGLGYRPIEFGMFGVATADRVARITTAVDIFRQAWTGEPFSYDGAPALVRPRPVRPSGPELYLAGSTPASARRAATLGVGYEPVPSYFAESPLYTLYQRECARLGRPAPPPYPRPGPRFLFVTHEPERDWERLFPYLAHQTNSYAQWRAEANPGDIASMRWSPVTRIEQLRADPAFAIVTPDECVEIARRLGPTGELAFYPLTGGAPPDLAWRGLQTFADQVLPVLRELGLVIRPSQPSGVCVSSTARAD
jgi:alkanesulfonate monooxygenase SsuD/methylene tetrahydromethanopterin reductase-like flavin-dependent oxidoreductase (luciferase family)